MERAIRLQCFQNLVNYRKPSSFIIKETFPLPPYSTVLGMIHAACGYTEFHPMKLCIQGTNSGMISELYTRYAFSAGAKLRKADIISALKIMEQNMERLRELQMWNSFVRIIW